MKTEKAIELYESKFWENMTLKERATFQIFEEKLCMPFGIFHEAVEKTLKRPVFTHEFGMNIEGLQKELMGEEKPPSLTDTINMIPEDKRIIVIGDDHAN